MISPETGDVATYVMMLRVAMLLPVVLAIVFVLSRRAEAGAAKGAPLLPTFLIAFAALVAVNSTGVIPRDVTGAVSDVSRWCLVTAIAALGMKTSFKDPVAVGWRPVGLMVAETAWIFAALDFGTILFVLIRFGLLAFVAMELFNQLSITLPLLRDFPAWYAQPFVVELLAIAEVYCLPKKSRNGFSGKAPKA